ncbi:uracil-5--methyltransferase TRM9 [Nemania sp. FL0031]|nr:uracil-5--methyltransferase TRM9 [Nemania sp. FL0031]
MSCPAGSHNTAEANAKTEPLPTTTTAATTTTGVDSSSSAGAKIRDAAALSPEAYEAEHVHSVYESIAGHFSSTRYKPWPFVASFLRERVAPGSVGLDVGCGNGKYLGVRGGGGGGGGDNNSNSTSTNNSSSNNTSSRSSSSDVHLIGSDRSPALVGIARGRGFEVAVADGLALPFRRACADFALCIAVVHHLSTRARRVDALRALLECVRVDGGQVLVYVWALEQGASSRRGWDATSEQDQLVPWVMKANQNKKAKQQQGDSSSGGGGGGVVGGEEDPAGPSADTTYERFYHLYREGELEDDMRAAGGRVIESGYERDNWWVIGGHAETP